MLSWAAIEQRPGQSWDALMIKIGFGLLEFLTVPGFCEACCFASAPI